MKRLLDADALSELVGEPIEVFFGRLDLKLPPTIDAEPVRHGKWIRQTDTRFGEMLNDILICSKCNIAFPTVNMIRRSYCPNCGARMDAERKEE